MNSNNQTISDKDAHDRVNKFIQRQLRFFRDVNSDSPILAQAALQAENDMLSRDLINSPDQDNAQDSAA